MECLRNVIWVVSEGVRFKNRLRDEPWMEERRPLWASVMSDIRRWIQAARDSVKSMSRRAQTWSIAMELSMSMTIDRSESGWERGSRSWRAEGARKEEWSVPAGRNESGSRGLKDMVAEAGGNEEGRTDKVGRENGVLL